MASLKLEPEDVKAALIARISKRNFYELRKKDLTKLTKVCYEHVVILPHWERDYDDGLDKQKPSIQLHLSSLTDVRALRARQARLYSLANHYNQFFWNQLASIAEEHNVDMIAWPQDVEKTAYHVYRRKSKFDKGASLGTTYTDRLLEELQVPVFKRQRCFFLDEESAHKLMFAYRHQDKLWRKAYKVKVLFQNVIEACVSHQSIHQSIDNDMITIKLGDEVDTIVINNLQKQLTKSLTERNYVSQYCINDVIWLTGEFSYGTITR